MAVALEEVRGLDVELQILASIDEDLAARETIEVSDERAASGQTDGPLGTMIPIFFDLESTITADITLKSLTLRQYSQLADIETCAITVGKEEVVTYFNPNLPGLPPDVRRITPPLISVLQNLARDKQYVWVAFNAAFDTRMLRFKHKVPHPVNVWCAMEGAMAAWPEFPGGYSLDNCSCGLGLPKAKRKFPIDLMELTKLRNRALQGPVRWKDIRDDVKTSIEKIAARGKLVLPEVFDIVFFYKILEIYNSQDVEAVREIYYRQMPRIAPIEQEVALRTHHQRRHHFVIDPDRLDALIKALDQEAVYAAEKAKDYLSEDQLSNVFNVSELDNKLQSVRYIRLKSVINQLKQDEDEDFTSASLKKISPVKLAKNPTVSKLLDSTTRVGKMLSHRRRSAVFYGVNEVDVELGFARAHTMRFSSPSVGRGLNCIAEGTLIPTEIGWLPIEMVPRDVRVWDGEEFVCHGGPIDQGVQTCITSEDLTLTPDHLVLCEGGIWEEACRALSFGTLKPVSASAGGLCWVRPRSPQEQESIIASMSSVTAGTSRIPLESSSPEHSNANGVPSGGGMPASPWNPTTVGGGPALAAGTTSKTAVSTINTANTIAGAAEESASATPGKTTLQPSSGACRTSPGTTDSSPIHCSRSIALTTTEDTSPGISESLPRNSSAETESGRSVTRESPSAKSLPTSGYPTPRCTSTSSTTTWRRVFDLVDCGPRQRFQAGSRIVHNCHNIPKHQKEVAKPIRQTFHLPDDLCFVRGDLSNVEYRIEGMLTECKTVRDMFDPAITGDPKSVFNDPYCLAWAAMTGMKINKKSPVRQVSKQAVLGLGFCMSAIGYGKVLLKAIADGLIKSEAILDQIIKESGWGTPPQKAMDRIRGALGCSNVISTAAYWIHYYFNKSHPEFRMTAEWLVSTVETIAAIPVGTSASETALAFDVARAKLDWMYRSQRAPRRDMINLQVENDPLSRFFNIRVACGPWAPTVCWREPQVRSVSFGRSDNPNQRQLTVMKATCVPKPFTPQLAIENVTQAAARNAMCMGVAKLDKMGFRDCIHIHDEVLLIVPRNRESVLAARDALLQTFGPKHDLPYGWAILVKPDEVTVTQSLWEDEDDVAPPRLDEKSGKMIGNDRWRKIQDNTPDCWDNLP